jgi:hypothetical protein
MEAPNYAARRSVMAKKSGLGRFWKEPHLFTKRMTFATIRGTLAAAFSYYKLAEYFACRH